jgi:acetolactate synthase small subunit
MRVHFGKYKSGLFIDGVDFNSNKQAVIEIKKIIDLYGVVPQEAFVRIDRETHIVKIENTAITGIIILTITNDLA